MIIQSFSGASVRRVVDRSHCRVPAHAHDWPVLSLFVLGSYRNETEIGELFICGPSAVFYRAGAAHRNTTSAVGFEQIEIEFDPDWLGQGLLPGVPVVRWIGGRAASEARDLARACQPDRSENELCAALQSFLRGASCQVERETVGWISAMSRSLREDTTRPISDLAKVAGRHPSWAASAYRLATGERPKEAAARFRVEHATQLLRETDLAYASIALESGFCDQSHMNRTFRRVLGRSPTGVREQRHAFRHIPGREPRSIEGVAAGLVSAF